QGDLRTAVQGSSAGQQLQPSRVDDALDRYIHHEPRRALRSPWFFFASHLAARDRRWISKSVGRRFPVLEHAIVVFWQDDGSRFRGTDDAHDGIALNAIAMQGVEEPGEGNADATIELLQAAIELAVAAF